MDKIGFTGTRAGLTRVQRHSLSDFLISLGPSEIHYGDCTGADYEMWMLCKAFGFRTVSHPPDVDLFRMFTPADYMWEPKPYLDRNKDIVSETRLLLACSRGMEEVTRSGTWSTVRYARRLSRPVVLFYPDGTVDNPLAQG